ncbi:alpha/beta hydrolase [Laspinema sp. D1]|uniref:Alpha/beta hydrolase n=1 Tax=Laspinema palackyanum D2a TaxID=2953684 RepID=A0ABT2MZL0_9CYAN|nr:alpha/beta hydrolase [Laspinema sp. D2a]
MSISRPYKDLPWSWDTKSPETLQNDCQWLESIVKNSAPFSDGWVKARIVQLAYNCPNSQDFPQPKNRGKSANRKPMTTAQLLAYGGKLSEIEIVEALQEECGQYCQTHPVADFSYFHKTVDETYVMATLNSWCDRHFSEKSARNFEIYQDLVYPNVFLVISTAFISLYVDRQLPPPERFRALFNVDEFAEIVGEGFCDRMTLRTHGYATSAATFYDLFRNEAKALNREESSPDSGLKDNHFYIGYHWPSEQPFTSPGLWKDFSNNWGVIFKFSFVLSGFAGIIGTGLYGMVKLLGLPLFKGLEFLPLIGPIWKGIQLSAVGLQWYWVVPPLFILWVLLMQCLRVLVYQRDRYRAIHYGAPDLAEFFWRLDRALNPQALKKTQKPKIGALTPDIGSIEVKNQGSVSLGNHAVSGSKAEIGVNLVGHSMGGLLLVNTLRILSDRFGKDEEDIEDPDRAEFSKIGDRLRLDKLILASPDIPLEFLREGRNNYVRSAMRRCRQIYLMSSDRDIILRYMPTLGNWFSEPSIEMSAYRLGNVYLQPLDDRDPNPKYHPYIRNVLVSQAAASPTSAYDLFERFNYIDCSETIGVNGIFWPLKSHRGLAIDLINTLMFLLSLSYSRVFGQLDLHGGYFLTHTATFKILKLLISHNGSEAEINEGIKKLIPGTKIRFLPRQPFLTKD